MTKINANFHREMPETSMPLGPLMIDIEGLSLSDKDRKRLMHPLVGGVILFRRHFESIEQLQAITQDIHALRHPQLLIAVDHEGGRVQRFRDGFTHLPPMRVFGEMYAEGEHERAFRLAEHAGWVMASELRACGVDFSFAPVVDLDLGVSDVIGDRGFSDQPDVVTVLARHLMQGMKSAGMASVIKHFPGHGSVEVDSHLALPEDHRTWDEINHKDLIPFRKLSAESAPAVMPAHMLVPAIDDLPIGFSKRWLQTILREELGFSGAIISDDLNMLGAVDVFPDPVERFCAALDAGCDLILVCNDLSVVDEILERAEVDLNIIADTRLIRLHGKGQVHWDELQQSPKWKQRSQALLNLHERVKQRGEEWMQ